MLTALLWRFRTPLAIAAGVVLLLGVLATVVHNYNAGQRAIGRAEAATARAEHEAARWKGQAARTDTIYRTDTVRLTRVRAHTDTVLATLTDTVVHVDTVRTLIAAERAACSAVVLTCEQRVAARDSLNAALRAQLAAKVSADRAARASLLTRATHAALWLGAGVAVGRLSH